jgi:hypothetical protein
MCRQSESIASLNDAADALSAACLALCPNEISRALKTAYDDTLAESLPEEFRKTLVKLQ